MNQALNKIGVAAAVALAMGAVSAPSLAADAGPYVTAELAYNMADIKASDLEAVSVDKNAVGFALGFGYQFTPNFGAEVDYLNLGKGSVDGGEGDVSIKVQGVKLVLIGSWPINDQWSFDVRGGMHTGKTKVPGFSEKNANFLVGVGVDCALTEAASIRLGFDHYHNAIDLGDKYSVNGITLGFKYGF